MRPRRKLVFMPRRESTLKTVDDYMALDVEHGVELIDGEFVVSPSPGRKHQRAVLRLGAFLDAGVRRLGLGDVFIAPFDVILSPHNALQPDVIFIARANLHRLKERLEGPPDIAVEFLSPSTASRDLKKKRDLYARFAVPEYWIGDPEARTFRVHELRDGAWSEPRIYGPGEVIESARLPGFPVPLDEIYLE
ncbi:MAG: Uma2 family endonuclease [Planctomycetes bacterium]|nr:Uma2 family endonuclease [Planctomycetota bacterium]